MSNFTSSQIIYYNTVFCFQWSVCGNYSDAGYHKHERPNSKMSVLQDNAERIAAVHPQGKSTLRYIRTSYKKKKKTTTKWPVELKFPDQCSR